jgi:hypothetical protein
VLPTQSLTEPNMVERSRTSFVSASWFCRNFSA